MEKITTKVNVKSKIVEKRHLWMPLSKNLETNNYQAILSDTSIDRDDERMSKDLIAKWASNPNRYIPMLIDHENKVMNMAGAWENPTILEKNGHHALAMEPKWFLSNPQAQIVKNMLDEGAHIGLSIGAIPKASREVTVDGQTINEWTKAELVETSLVPIGSNRNTFMNIAKSFNYGGKKMADDEQKDTPPVDDAPATDTQDATPPADPAPADKGDDSPDDADAGDTDDASDNETAEATKALLEEVKKLRSEVTDLKKATKLSRTAEMKAVQENTDVNKTQQLREDMSVWDQMAMIKGVN